MYIKAIRSIRKKTQKLTLQSTYERTYKTQNLLLFKVLRITLNSIKSTESLQLTLMSLLQMLLHSTTPPPSKKGGRNGIFSKTAGIYIFYVVIAVLLFVGHLLTSWRIYRFLITGTLPARQTNPNA